MLDGDWLVLFREHDGTVLIVQWYCFESIVVFFRVGWYSFESAVERSGVLLPQGVLVLGG